MTINRSSSTDRSRIPNGTKQNLAQISSCKDQERGGRFEVRAARCTRIQKISAARRLRLPTHIAAFSTVKTNGSAKPEAGDVKPATPEPQVIIEPEQDSPEWERRDLNFEAMSQKIVGVIKTRPGGRQEMGNSVVTGEPTRPRPADRHTTLQSGPDEDTVVAAGTLNLKQIQEVFLLYQEKKWMYRA